MDPGKDDKLADQKAEDVAPAPQPLIPNIVIRLIDDSDGAAESSSEDHGGDISEGKSPLARMLCDVESSEPHSVISEVPSPVISRRPAPFLSRMSSPARSTSSQRFPIQGVLMRDRIEVRLCGKCSSLPSFLPDCLKVCTWLKALGIEYTSSYHKLNLEGRYPRVMFGKTLLNNNNRIISELSERLDLNLDRNQNFSSREQKIAFGLGALVEDYLGEQHREWCRTEREKLLRAYDINLKQCWTKSRLGDSVVKWKFIHTASRKKPSEPAFRATNTSDILYQLSDLMGQKGYFFDEDFVSSLDVRVFAVIAPILAVPAEIPYKLRDKIKASYHGRLVKFTERMKQRFFSDWNADAYEVNLHDGSSSNSWFGPRAPSSDIGVYSEESGARYG